MTLTSELTCALMPLTSELTLHCLSTLKPASTLFAPRSGLTQRVMAERIREKLGEIKRDLLSLHGIDSLRELCDEVSDILTQINLQKSLNETVQLLREGKPPPVRRFTFNLKQLHGGTAEGKSRWEKLQTLSFEALILCTVSFPRLVHLSTNEFTWLTNKADVYLEAQDLSPSWIDSVSTVIAKIPEKENTITFRRSMYFAISVIHLVRKEGRAQQDVVRFVYNDSTC